MSFLLKRTVRDIGFIIALLVLLLLPFAASKLGQNVKMLPSGIYLSEGADAFSEELAEAMVSCGAYRTESEDELRRMIRDGELDNGIVMAPDMERHFETGDFSGSFVLLESENSVSKELWRMNLVEAVFSRYAPHITEKAMEDAGVSGLSAEERFKALMEEGFIFTFETVRLDGVRIENGQSYGLFTGTVAVLLSAVLYLTVCAPITKDSKMLSKRIGTRKAVLLYLLPSLAIRVLLVGLVLAGSAFISGFPAAIGGLVVTELLLTVFWELIALFVPQSFGQALCVILSGLSLALCPIMVDFSLFAPIVGKLRVILPEYWIYFFT